MYTENPRCLRLGGSRILRVRGVTKTAVLLVDGGHLRVLAQIAGYKYNVDFIWDACVGFGTEDEDLIRVLYYDCPPFRGKKRKPVSNEVHEFCQSDEWLHDLAARERFAVRLGVLKWRGWKPRKVPLPNREPTDADFVPNLEQKGVDLRIGLDIAIYAETGNVDRIVVVTADTDLIPAMKLGRRAGIEIVGVELPRGPLTRELKAHVDVVRKVSWPANHTARPRKT